MGKPRTNQTERFWAGVDKSGDCWLWQRAVLNTGYGMFRVTEPARRMMGAHKFSYELAYGPITDGMKVDHICHTPRCVRPDHLRAVTAKQNMEHRTVGSRQARSGVRGVVWNGILGKWMSQVRHKGKLHIGGYFETVEAAAESVRQLRNELFTHNTFDRTQGGISMIPDEAVEAAAMALHFFKTGKGWKDADPATVWECREQAESIIRQAAPHLMAAAWERGQADLINDVFRDQELQRKGGGLQSEDATPNPYRKADRGEG